jgi:membrane-bound ClpP family serine protease
VKLLRHLAKPLPVLVAAILAIVLALLYIDHGWLVPTIVAGAVLVVAGAFLLAGRLLFVRAPYLGGWLMESWIFVATCAAAVAGAVLVWYAIEEAPGDNPTAREEEVFSAVSAALAAYLGSVIIEPEGERWNPVKTAIGKEFKSSFNAGRTDLEKDAREAVRKERYSALAAGHDGDVVDGWGWDARRVRTRHIRDQLKT